ncbi:MAG: hypothetical protein CME59_22565 [Halioglobus sp.]|nr:hypothetical protein [Halioglobus sp.]|tara:strand:- start:354 stop:686 length:333 start_codon:yes stop_codon:yes gene_type:complete
MDAYLSSLEGSRIHFCSAEPADYADIANYELAAQDVVGAHAKANGDIDGRKTTCPAQTAVPITTSGVASHVVLSDGVGGIARITTCSPQALTAGGTLNSNSFAHTLRAVT